MNQIQLLIFYFKKKNPLNKIIGIGYLFAIPLLLAGIGLADLGTNRSSGNIIDVTFVLTTFIMVFLISFIGFIGGLFFTD